MPIGRGFGVYASYAHGFMDAKIRELCIRTPLPVARTLERQDFDADYDVAELRILLHPRHGWLAPHMPLSAATVYAGYRYQNISTEFDEPGFQDRSDVTKGFAVGLNLTF